MAIKAAQIIHTGDTTLIQRLQDGGPGGLNIALMKDQELGNDQAVGTTRGTPDLTFTMTSWDTTTALEKLLTKGTAAPYDLTKPQSLDIASQWKAGPNNPSVSDLFQVVEGIAIPQVSLETLAYSFGTEQQAAKTATLRGDAIFYCPGPVVVEQFVGSGTAGQALVLTHPAGVYNGDTLIGPRYALNVSVAGQRLIPNVDYTEGTVGATAYKTVTITLTNAAATGAAIQVVYFTNDVITYPQSVHSATTVKPSSIRGKDITIFVNGVAATNRWTGVQNVALEERFTIQKDEEFGNPYTVDSDYSDVPTVSGSITVRARNPQDFHVKLRSLAGVAGTDEAIGPNTGDPVRLDIVLHHPETGAVLETLEVADAKLTLPGFSARVATKTDIQIPFQSDKSLLSALDTAPV